MKYKSSHKKPRLQEVLPLKLMIGILFAFLLLAGFLLVYGPRGIVSTQTPDEKLISVRDQIRLEEERRKKEKEEAQAEAAKRLDEYRVFAAGEIYGPVSKEQILEWIESGQVKRETKISRNDDSYQDSVLYPEFKEHFQ